MSGLNVGEDGKTIRFGVGEDVSGATNKIILKDPAGNETEHDAVAGTVDVQTTRGLFLANEYVTYAIADESIIDVAGTWSARVTSDFGTRFVKTDWERLRVRE